jgi:hypothetical protein
VLHYKDWVVVLIQDGPELDGGEGPPYYQVHVAAVHPAKDARADAGDENDPELLQVRVAVQSSGKYLLKGYEVALKL